MSQSEERDAAMPTQCKGGCGFFGTAALQDHCSVCYKKLCGTPALLAATSSSAPPALSLGATAAAAATGVASSFPRSPASVAASEVEMGDSSSPKVAANSSSLAGGIAAALDAAANSPSAAAGAGGAAMALDGADGGGGDKKAVPRNRCNACKKKVGLTGFECRCGMVFCGVHRYADQHACTFDFKAHDHSILVKNNQKVVADKLEKV